MMPHISSAMLDWFQIAIYFAILLLAIKPLGHYCANALEGRTTFLSPLLGRAERGIYWACKINPAEGMNWKNYTASLFCFSFSCLVCLFLILFCQSYPDVSADLAFNASVSFVTNTNWQSAAPETTLDTSSQMLGLAVQNFLSAAIGLAVMAAFARGLARNKTEDLGNFWVDVTRTILYILLPLSFILAVVLVSQGVVQTFGTLITTTPLDTDHAQTIMTGPVASQVAIKQIGTNGGGYFNANAAHPFENPNPVTNFIEMLAILLLPASLPWCFGKMVGNLKEGRTLLVSMFLIFVPLALCLVFVEQHGNPLLSRLDLSQALGNMEGKEIRIGAASSAFWAALTTAASNGSTNAALDSFLPLGGLVPLVLIQFGEIIFGGVGSGLYGMLICVMLTVFVAGLMIGRTPEYLGKKIGVFEIKMASLVILVPAITTLLGTACAVLCATGQLGATNPVFQGFSQILYATASASNNNGSALGGIAANVPFYNVLLGLSMLIGRYAIIAAVLAIAGSMGSKTLIPKTQGTLDTTTPLFTFLLVGVIVLVGVLTYIPALMLGPVAEHLHLAALR